MISEVVSVIENALARAGYEIMGGTETSLIFRERGSDSDYVVRVEEDDWS